MRMWNDLLILLHTCSCYVPQKLSGPFVGKMIETYISEVDISAKVTSQLILQSYCCTSTSVSFEPCCHTRMSTFVAITFFANIFHLS